MSTGSGSDAVVAAVRAVQELVDEAQGLPPDQRIERVRGMMGRCVAALGALAGVEDVAARDRWRRELVDRIVVLQHLGSPPRGPGVGPESGPEVVQRRLHEVMHRPTVVSFATIDENGRPWTRYVVAMADENLNLVVTTARSSRKCAHVRRHPEVHVCFRDHTGDTDMEYVQIVGTARVVDDPEILRACWSPMLWLYFSGPDDPEFVVIQVAPERAELWNLADLKRGVGAVVWNNPGHTRKVLQS